MVLFPPPFYFVFYISNLLSYIQNNFSYELARPIMGTIFLVIFISSFEEDYDDEVEERVTDDEDVMYDGLEVEDEEEEDWI